MPKERRKSNFVNWEFMLRRSGKTIAKDEILLQVPMQATKPEIKQYLQKIYQFDVRKVNTLITMGKIKHMKNSRSRPS
jgi:ribosomal protein L23